MNIKTSKVTMNTKASNVKSMDILKALMDNLQLLKDEQSREGRTIISLSE
jgi:hypothetical protein